MIGEGLVSLVGVPLLLRRKTRIRPEAIYVRSTKLELVLMMQTIVLVVAVVVVVVVVVVAVRGK